MPGLPQAFSLFGGQAAGDLANLFGSSDWEDALKQAQQTAKGDITQGYGSAIGAQQPIAKTGVGAYQNLAGKFAAGGFAQPNATPYTLDGGNVLNDPTYKAQMESGVNAINSGAEGKGDLFSSTNEKNLEKFGQDTFAGRENALFGQGFAANTEAAQQNAQNAATQFGEGLQIAQPGIKATDNLSSLFTDQGNTLAKNDLLGGQIRGTGINQAANSLGSLFGSAGGDTADYFGHQNDPSIQQPGGISPEMLASLFGMVA